MLGIINRILNNFGIKQNIKPIIGRWTVDYNINRINRKVDLSNEDHCGTCTSPSSKTLIVNTTAKTNSIYNHKSFNYNLTKH